ncbi:putative nitrilase protein [Seiridium unicorne]|uniref:Nitrilase protein n=1 Tax=Seiridium unicorne TaxID=138068 RepID=A0ABR2V5F0_9PEZI
MFLDTTGTLLKGLTVTSKTSAKEYSTFFNKTKESCTRIWDLEDCIKDNQYHDVVGGYQRLDVFDLKVDRTRRTPNTFVTNREHQAHDATSPNPKNASMNGAGYN